MAGYSNTISILIAAKDEASKVLGQVADDAKATSSRLETIGDAATATGKTLTSHLTLPIVGLGVAAVKMAGDFQASMTRLVTSAGESSANLKQVSDGVLQVAKDTGTSTDELAKAMYTIESGGQHGADGLLVLKAAAQGAKAENSDLKTTADAVTSVLVDYHLKASDAADVTSKLVAATSQGKTTFEELAGAMPAILPVASAAHVSLSDILGDLASMTVHGMSAQQSAENLADAIRHMQNPTAMQAKELALLGMTTTQLADDLKNKGLSGTLQEISNKISGLMPPGSDKVILDLRTALSGLAPQVQNLGLQLFNGTMTMKDYTKAAGELDPISAKQALSFATLAGATHRIGDAQMTGYDVMQNYSQALAKATGDATGLKVALMLTGENADITNKAIATIAGTSTEAGGNVKGWAEIQETFNYKLAVFEQTMKVAAITVGNDLLPPMTRFVEHVGNAVKKFEELSPEQRHFIEDVAGAVAVLGPAVLIFGKFATALSAIGKLFGGVNAAARTFKTIDIASTASRGALALGRTGGLAAGAEEATAALSGGGGLLAALGPVGLGIAAVAVAAGAGYLAYKALNVQTHQNADSLREDVSPAIKQYQALAKDLGVTLGGTSSQMSLLTLAQKENTAAYAMRDAAVDRANQTDDAAAEGVKRLTTVHQSLLEAQNQVTQALNQFGANSPQYQAAIASLDQAQLDYNLALQENDRLALKVIIDHGTMADAQALWAKNVQSLADLTSYLNGVMEGTVGVIARFGPMAIAQVPAIDTLKVHVADVITTWNGFNADFGLQVTQNSAIVQGLGSTINRVQGQSDVLNATLSSSNASAKQLSTSVNGFSLQGGNLPGHALGTQFAPGGLSLVGETGPELVELPRGSKVTPAKQTSSTMAKGGSSVFIENLNVNNDVDVTRVVREIGWQLALR